MVVRAFEIDPNENPMITALRKFGEEEQRDRESLARLKEMWPDIMAAAPYDAKPWDEMNPDLLMSMARRFASWS